MNTMKLLAIAKREWYTMFTSPMAFLLIGCFLAIEGVFFYIFTIGSNTVDLVDVFGNVAIAVFMLCPLLAMRSISEEKKSGTIELLLTSPIRSIEIILGKYLGVVSLYALMLMMTLVGPVFLEIMNEVHWPAVLVQYLGLFLLGATVISFGIVFSSLTENQVVAGVLAMVFSLSLFLISFLKSFTSGVILKIVNEVTILGHYASFNHGVFDLKDFIYFLMLIATSIFISHKQLAAWRS